VELHPRLLAMQDFIKAAAFALFAQLVSIYNAPPITNLIIILLLGSYCPDKVNKYSCTAPNYSP